MQAFVGEMCAAFALILVLFSTNIDPRQVQSCVFPIFSQDLRFIQHSAKCCLSSQLTSLHILFMNVVLTSQQWQKLHILWKSHVLAHSFRWRSMSWVVAWSNLGPRQQNFESFSSTRSSMAENYCRSFRSRKIQCSNRKRKEASLWSQPCHCILKYGLAGRSGES